MYLVGARKAAVVFNVYQQYLLLRWIEQ